MASEIGVQKLMHTNATQAATINASGQLTIEDGLHKSEGGAVSTSIGQGLAKAWAHMTLGTTAIEDSLNCSSVSDDATGRFTITRTNNMDNADYSVAGACMADRVGLVGANADDTFTASQNKFSIVDSRDASYGDYSRACFQICGDLA